MFRLEKDEIVKLHLDKIVVEKIRFNGLVRAELHDSEHFRTASFRSTLATSSNVHDRSKLGKTSNSTFRRLSLPPDRWTNNDCSGRLDVA